MGIPADKTVSHVAGITQRAAQSVRRWFDASEPGLPDLESFARLCTGLGCSTDEIIGMKETKTICTIRITAKFCVSRK